MVKNTGIPGNQMSDYDPGSVLKDSHIKRLHALDVNVINSLVPERYAKVTFEDITLLDGTQDIEYINFYDAGIKQITKLDLRSTIHGQAEITTFPFTNQNAANLANRYVTLYDDVGKVVPWFNLDSGGVEPVVSGASRYISIPISTGDINTTLASKFATTMSSDSKFTGAAVASLVAIQVSSIGNKTDSTGGDTTMSPAIIDGISTLNNQYLYLNSTNDLVGYYIWFNYNSGGSDPNIAGKTGIEISYTNSTTFSELNELIVSCVNVLDDFAATYSDSLYITNASAGPTTLASDANSGTNINLITSGSDGSIVARIRVFYDDDSEITSIENIT